MSQQDLKFGGVRVALLDQNMSMRRLIRSSLNSVGFTSILECRNAEDLTGQIKTNELDLMMIDLDNENDHICRLIRKIRNCELGDNPFVVILALTWHPEREVIRQALSAGADDVVTKPVSAKILAERVTNLIEHRREFVVTESYIGPERRSLPDNRPGDLPTIKVPNTLRYKATGDKSAAVDHEDIKRSRREVKIQKVYRYATKIAAQTTDIEERLAKNGEAGVPRHHLEELAEIVGAINDSIVREDLEHLSGIGASMTSVMDGILRAEAPTKRQLEILRLHGHAVVASVQDQDGAAAIVAQALERAANVIETKPAKAARSG